MCQHHNRAFPIYIQLHSKTYIHEQLTVIDKSSYTAVQNQDIYMMSKFSQTKAHGGNLPSGFCRVEIFLLSFGTLTVLI